MQIYCGFIYFRWYQFSWIEENIHFRGYLILWFGINLHKFLKIICHSLDIKIRGFLKSTWNWYPTNNNESTVVYLWNCFYITSLKVLISVLLHFKCCCCIALSKCLFCIGLFKVFGFFFYFALLHSKCYLNTSARIL